MKTTVKHTTEWVGGKEYPLTITKHVGYQEIVVEGRTVAVERVTLFESPLGNSLCYTPARPPASPEEREAGKRMIREIATKAMINQGIW